MVGPEALEDKDRLLLAAAAAMREFVLGQSAFDPNDAFSPPAKTFALADAALRAFDIAAATALARGLAFADLSLDGVRRALAAAARCVRRGQRCCASPRRRGARRNGIPRGNGRTRQGVRDRRPDVSRRTCRGGSSAVPERCSTRRAR